MHIEIAKKDFIDAIDALKKKKPLGRGGKLFLNSNVGLNLIGDTAVFAIGVAQSSCKAKGIWAGEVMFSFQVAMALVKVQPKSEIIIIHFDDGQLQVGPLKVSAVFR